MNNNAIVSIVSTCPLIVTIGWKIFVKSNAVESKQRGDDGLTGKMIAIVVLNSFLLISIFSLPLLSGLST